AKLDVREMDDVAVFEEVGWRALPVHERAIRAVEVAHDVPAIGDLDRRVFLRHLARIDGVVGGFRSADGEGQLPDGNALGRPACLREAFEIGGRYLMRAGLHDYPFSPMACPAPVS